MNETGLPTPRHDGSVTRLLRLEGAAAFTGGLILWAEVSGDWLLFVPLLLAPDLSMLGYLRGPSVGAVVYNVVHNWALAGLGLGIGWIADQPLATLAGIVLLAHIGIDRLSGFGLKYPTSFQDTHLGRIGRRTGRD